MKIVGENDNCMQQDGVHFTSNMSNESHFEGRIIYHKFSF